MNQDSAVVVALIIVTVLLLIGQIWRNKDLEKQLDCHKRSIDFLEARIAQRDREGERNFKDLVGGIDGVTSVSLSAKRYVELLRAEESLVELQLKVRELGNGK